METTNLDHSTDEELIAELRGLVLRVEGLLGQVRQVQLPPLRGADDPQPDLAEMPARVCFLDADSYFVN